MCSSDLGGVGAVEGRQDAGHGGLHAEGDAREARVREPGQSAGADGVGVGLQRDLGARGDADALVQAVEGAGQFARGQHRGGASPEEHCGGGAGADPRVVEDADGQGGLGQDGAGVGVQVGSHLHPA